MTVGTIDPAIMQLSGTVPTLVEDALLATTKALALTVPAPRGDPYYGIDRIGGPGLRLLHRLSRHGDFRKYVVVLDANAGLGGQARWLALRFGCRVVGLDPSAARAGLLTRLSRRIGVGDRACGIAGHLEAIPCRDGAFTQVWTVEALPHASDRRRATGRGTLVTAPRADEVAERDGDCRVVQILARRPSV